MAFAKFIYNALDFYALSSGRFRDTPFAEKTFPIIENKIGQIFDNFKNIEKLSVQETQKHFGVLFIIGGLLILLLLTLLKYLATNLQIDFWKPFEEGIGYIGLFLLSCGFITLLSLKWVFEHKKSFYFLLIFFVIISLIMLTIFSLLIFLTGENIPIEMKLTALAYVCLYLIISFAIIYVSAWVVLGTPPTVIKTFIWLSSKVSNALRENYNENNFKYAMMIARLIVWISEFFISISISLIIYFKSFEV